MGPGLEKTANQKGSRVLRLGSRSLTYPALVVLAIGWGDTTSWSQSSSTTGYVSDRSFGGGLESAITGQMAIFASGTSGSIGLAFDNSGKLHLAKAGNQTVNPADEFEPQSQTEMVSGIQHIIWIWFENREVTQITSTTAPYFTSFATANVNLTNFYGITHPSQPNYLHAFSGSNQGVIDNNYCTFPASTDNLAKQLAGCRLMAADVNGDTMINTVDVVAIQRFFLGLSTGIADVGQYQFTPASRSYPGVVSDQTAQNYDALVFGDIASPFAERLDFWRNPDGTVVERGKTSAKQNPGTLAE